MKPLRPVIDYSKFRLSKLNTPEFSHLKLLIFWPVFGVLFYMVERLMLQRYHYPMYCGIDDFIPFNEWFLLPYLFWYVFLIGMHIYTLIYDVKNFRKMMKYIIITYTAALVIYIIFPNCQQLRPLDFERNNMLTRFLSRMYQFDTNTNVCPSIHVIGSMAVLAASIRARGISKNSILITGFSIIAFFISISTVFLKQHSVLDIFAALPICVIADYICFQAKHKSGIREG